MTDGRPGPNELHAPPQQDEPLAVTPIKGRRRLTCPAVLLALFHAALSLAWVLGNPVGAAPDEPSQYLKALAVGGGELTSEVLAVPPPPPPSLDTDKPGAWLRRTSRVVDVPPGLSPQGLACNAFKPTLSAACQEGLHPSTQPTKALSNHGPAHPTPYVVPGLLARRADNPVTAIQLGRLGNAVVSIGLVWLAVALLWDRSSGLRSVVGLLAAVTPMVIFVASSLSASGPEVAAGICFFSALLRVTRPSTPQAWHWLALGVSGAFLATSRTLGPLAVAFDVGVVLVAHGFGRSWALLRSAGKRAVWASTALAGAVALSLWWELAVQPHNPLDGAALKAAMVTSLDGLDRVFGELIGVFGWLDSYSPLAVYVLWWLALGVLVFVALLTGTWRARLVLLLLIGGTVMLTLVIAWANIAQTGFGMQGRYVLPVAVAVPLFAGEVLARDARRWWVPVDRWLALFFVLAGALHATAWYANARRVAVGTRGPWLFMGSSEWSPRTGWYPLAVLVAVAVVGVVLCGVDVARHRIETEVVT